MAEILAVVCSAIFAGAALYISLVQHPAALAAGTAVAARLFPPMYQRAAPMQASLAVVGSAAGAVAWMGGSGHVWLIGTLLLASVVPLTLVVIKPTNDRLLEDTLDPSSHEALELLQRWGRLHAIRSLASTAAFACFLFGAS
jgi:uncharacterized membrane protein